MKRPVNFSIFLLWATSIASAQQTGSLEQQLQELKQQYADSARLLEQRIGALEKQITEQMEAIAQTKAGTVSAAELAAANVEKSGSRRIGSGRRGISRHAAL